MDAIRPLEGNRWFVGAVCAIGLVASWASYWAVYRALPGDAPLAHWALELLVLAATGGFLLIAERALLAAVRRGFSASAGDGASTAPSIDRIDRGRV